MTKDEFRTKIPGLIRHKNHGEQYVRVKEYNSKKTVSYTSDKPNMQVTSFSISATTWEELYGKLKDSFVNRMDELVDPPFNISM